MFDNHAARIFKLLDAFECCIGIGDVIKRKCFALNLHCAGNTGFLVSMRAVESGRLMGVFAVAHRLRMLKLQVQSTWKSLVFRWLHHVPEVIRNGAIVLCRVLISLDRQ